MKQISLFLLMLPSILIFSQNGKFENFKSPQYGYTIELPETFKHKDKIGKNVDLKVVDSYGNSIVIVIVELPPNENLTTNDMLEIPNDYWENNLQLPNVKVVKKGEVSVDNKKGMFLHYTTTEINSPMTLYYINYYFTHKGFLYTITSTCDISDQISTQPIFYRAMQSIKFPK